MILSMEFLMGKCLCLLVCILAASATSLSSASSSPTCRRDSRTFLHDLNSQCPLSIPCTSSPIQRFWEVSRPPCDHSSELKCVTRGRDEMTDVGAHIGEMAAMWRMSHSTGIPMDESEACWALIHTLPDPWKYYVYRIYLGMADPYGRVCYRCFSPSLYWDWIGEGHAPAPEQPQQYTFGAMIAQPHIPEVARARMVGTGPVIWHQYGSNDPQSSYGSQ